VPQQPPSTVKPGRRRRAGVPWARLLRLMGLAAAVSAVSNPACAAREPVVAGWVENTWIGDGGPSIRVRAKLDSGAKSSSINAPDYELYTHEGKRWVRFRLINERGEGVRIEERVVRSVRIKRAGVRMRKRPVVRLRICVAGVSGRAQFTLADRSDMNYQLLIGRTFLKGRILVDSSRSFLGSGKCERL